MRILIPNFTEYQHYGARRPPWIKLHRKVLEDFEFMALSPESQIALIFSWILAADNSLENGYGVVDTSFEKLAWRLRVTDPIPFVKSLLLLKKEGFVEVELTVAEAESLSSASTTLATREHEASEASAPEEKRREEKRPTAVRPAPQAAVAGIHTPSIEGGVGGDPPPRRQSWPREAATDWDDRFGKGSAQAARIGSALQRLVEAHTWDVVRPVWRRYLAEKDPTYCTPQDFAAKYGAWADGTVYAGGAEGRDKFDVEGSTKRALNQFLAGSQRTLPTGEPPRKPGRSETAAPRTSTEPPALPPKA